MSERATMIEDRTRARRRALRAAQVVTLGLALAGGCYGSRSPEQAAADAGLGTGDSALLTDGGVGDVGAVADAGICDAGVDWEAYIACCDAHAWDWDWGCMAWGPYVPPGEGTLPPSRHLALRGVG